MQYTYRHETHGGTYEILCLNTWVYIEGAGAAIDIENPLAPHAASRLRFKGRAILTTRMSRAAVAQLLFAAVYVYVYVDMCKSRPIDLDR